jgi:tetratricopeptide (TPR) repeat protein
VKLWEVATGEERMTLKGHRNCVRSLTFSPDGKTLASSSFDRTVKLWNVGTGELKITFEGHADEVNAVAFSPDGTTLASGSSDHTVRLWDLTTGELRSIIKAHGVLTVAFSPDGHTLAVAGTDGVIRLWRAAETDEKPATEYTRATEINLDDAELWLRRAQFCANRGRFKEASEDFKKALELKPDDAELWARRARFYANRGRSEEAHADFSKALELKPEDSALWVQLARFYLSQVQGEKATAALKNAIELGGSDPQLAMEITRPLVEQAKSYARGGDWENAAADFAKAIELSPDDAFNRYWCALTRLAAEDVEGYRKCSFEMLEHFARTQDVDAGHWVARTCALGPDAVDDLPNAIALARKAVESNPKSVIYLDTLGAILWRAGQIEEAIRRLSESDRLVTQLGRTTSSSPAYTWFFLAMAHQRLGQNDEARKWLDKAVAWTDKVLAEEEQPGGTSLAWNRRLTLKLLRAEAAKALGATETPKEPKQENGKAANDQGCAKPDSRSNVTPGL